MKSPKFQVKEIKKFRTLKEYGELSNICSTYWQTKGICMPCVVTMNLVVDCEYILKLSRENSVLKREHKLTQIH